MDASARLAAFLPASLPRLTDDQLVGFADAVEVLARQADGLRLAVAREFDDRTDASLGDDSVARKLGQKTVAGALELVTRTSDSDARRRVVEARSLAKLPVVAEAVEKGVLGRVQAAEITAPLLPALYAADPGLVEAACAQLVELAAAVPASAVAEAARAWAAVLDPDGIEPGERLAIEKRFVRLGRARGGLVKLTGLLTVEQAATMRAVLDAYVNPKAKPAFAPAGDGEHAALVATWEEPPAETRTAGQKRADVLAMVCAAQARAAEAPTMGGAHPTVLVTVTEEELEAGSGAAWLDGEAEPVSVKTARRIACAGGLQHVELGGSGEVLNLGRTQRCFSPAQRRALAVRDQGCVIPGCAIPARWCEAHHVHAHRDGGPTDIGNAALLCWWHHQTIDDGPWQLRMTDGTPELRWLFGSHASPWVKAVHQPRP
jgi:hypothetical protein